jgi:hypothetical protein
MKVELCITRDRVPYIVGEFGADKVVVSKFNIDQDLIVFEANGQMDFLMMFHAGIKCGSDSMARVFSPNKSV